jgi:predicted PurR-regulated permease PerM
LFGPQAKKLGHVAILAVRATVNGLVLVGFAEGVLIGIAYFVAGLNHALWFALATGVLATVPFGAPLVYGIACIVLVIDSRPVAATLVFCFASVVLFFADHLVRPALIGATARLPFLLVLLSIFGGLETFGFVGLFLGPAIVAAALALWREAARPAATPFADHTAC